MNYDVDRNASPTGTAIVITLLLALVVVTGLIVAGGAALIAFQSREARQQAMAAQEQAMVAAQRAHQEVELSRQRDLAATAATSSKSDNAAVPGDKIKLSLDVNGSIQLAGSEVPLAELQNQLAGTMDARTAVVLVVHRQCLFQHVANVMSVCRETGITDIRFAALKQREIAADSSIDSAAEEGHVKER